ncbi:hypothetical protein CSC70_11865 [Pseudoxanthomonas kalamensis DSM 18571]|uniref:DUF1631 family protein n=1 Tax=Pseudoxanthomonas kalamensis TaxID=289483 RepID=UPI001B863493|nr:DUF1631 family protein [Pseudoxanthomonas kalamensis]KAF1708801.1 hypothetical protein CSC70_11865 [Pseudoxanthomonas kalamensis DSM 18571]
MSAYVPSNVSPDKPDSSNQRLLTLLRETVLPPLQDAFTDVIDGLRESVLERAERLEMDRGPVQEGLFAVRQRRDAMLAAYRTHLVRAWQALESGEALPTQLAFDDEASDLGLVQNDQLEVQLATGHLAESLAREWKSELLALNGYLSWVDPGLRIHAEGHPFSPLQIAMAVYRAFVVIDVPGPVRRLMVECCERDLVELLGPIYETVLSCLVREFGNPDSLTARSRRGSAIPSSEETQEPEPDWLTRFFVEWEGVVGAPGSAKPAADADKAPTLPPELHALLEESRGLREQAGERTLVTARGPQNVLGQRELVSALTLMQIAPEPVLAAMMQPLEHLLEHFKQELLQTVTRLGVEPGAVRLSAEDENIIDLVGMLFQVIFEESQLEPRQQLLLGKLMAPLAKVALQDRQLFLQSTHPARRLLNILVDACDGNSGQTAPEQDVLKQVEQTISRLIEQFDESQAVFRGLRADFNASYADYRAETEEIERETAERERLAEATLNAQAWARELLQQKLAGRSLPLPLMQCLLDDWVPYAAGMQARGRAQAGTTLLDGLLQAQGSVKGAEDAGGWQAMLDWLQPAWIAQGRNPADIRDIKARLVAELGSAASADAAATVQQLSAEAPAPAPVEGSLEADARAEVEIDTVTAEYFSQLPLGSWLDFVDRNNRVQAGKLSWISPISSKRMFVSRTGARICVASPEELAALAKLQRVRQHRDEDAFYSAMQGVVDRLDAA